MCPWVTLITMACLLLRWWMLHHWVTRAQWAPRQTNRHSIHSRTGPYPTPINTLNPITKWNNPLSIATKRWRLAPCNRRRNVCRWYWMLRRSKTLLRKKWSYMNTLVRRSPWSRKIWIIIKRQRRSRGITTSTIELTPVPSYISNKSITLQSSASASPSSRKDTTWRSWNSATLKG